MPETDPRIHSGIDYLLAAQSADGSWGDPKDPDICKRCHITWTAVDGLRDFDRPDMAVRQAALTRLWEEGCGAAVTRGCGHSALISTVSRTDFGAHCLAS